MNERGRLFVAQRRRRWRGKGKSGGCRNTCFACLVDYDETAWNGRYVGDRCRYSVFGIGLVCRREPDESSRVDVKGREEGRKGELSSNGEC